MEIFITGRNTRINPKLEEYAREKVDRLDRFLPGISEVRVDLYTQDNRRGADFNIAQITVRHRRGAIIRAEERSTADFEIAINEATDKVLRRIQRFKGKRTDRRVIDKETRFAALPEELEIAEEITGLDLIDAAVAEYEALPADQSVVRHKNIDITAMSEEEAAEQMELLGHSFFMFFNTNTNSINVVYRRHDGDYGVLVPQTPQA